VKHWKKSQKLTPSKRNVVHDPLVDAAKVFLPPLYIKFGLVKKFCQRYEEGCPVFFICAAEIPLLE
jgi:hypothetical protein